jgi:hypothetical protein
MQTEPLESAKKLFVILLGIDIAFTAVVGLNAFSTIGTLMNIQSGARVADQSLLSSLAFWDWFSKLIILTTIGVGFGLVRWLDSCYRFAKDSLGATGFKNERWTAAGWIIPFFNFFKPYQIINEIHKAGAPNYTTSDGWQKERGSGLLLTWWIFWVMTHFSVAIIAKLMFRDAIRDDVTLQQAIGISEMQVWFCIVSIVIAGLWLSVANTLTQRLLSRTVLPAAKGASEQFVSPISAAIPAMTTTQQPIAVGHAPKQQLATKNVPDMKARHIAIATAIAILLASAFPPFQITISNRIVGLGYSFLFSPPLYRGSSQMIGSVDLGTLFAEYAGILAIGALAWLFATSVPSVLTASATNGDQPANVKWRRTKAGAATGIVIVAAIFGWDFIRGDAYNQKQSAAQNPWERDWSTPSQTPLPSLDKFIGKPKPPNPDASDKALKSIWDSPDWKAYESQSKVQGGNVYDQFDEKLAKNEKSAESSTHKFLKGGSETERAARYGITLQEFQRREARAKVLCVRGTFHDFNCWADVHAGLDRPVDWSQFTPIDSDTKEAGKVDWSQFEPVDAKKR